MPIRIEMESPPRTPLEQIVAAHEPLPTIDARLYSHTIRFGYQEGGPADGQIFLRNWNSRSIRDRDGHWYKINRERVEWHGHRYCVVFEYHGTTDPEGKDSHA